MHVRTYWPHGQLNACYVQDADYRNRYTCCFDAQGVDLAPGGQGRYREVLGIDEEDGRLCWREGQLVDGLLEGRVTWYAGDPDGGQAEATGQAEFQRGLENWE